MNDLVWLGLGQRVTNLNVIFFLLLRTTILYNLQLHQHKKKYIKARVNQSKTQTRVSFQAKIQNIK